MRKHMGMFDENFLARVDREADKRGQTRVMFVTRAIERELPAPKPARRHRQTSEKEGDRT